MTLEKQGQCPPCRANIDRLPKTVQNQHMLVEYRTHFPAPTGAKATQTHVHCLVVSNRRARSLHARRCASFLSRDDPVAVCLDLASTTTVIPTYEENPLCRLNALPAGVVCLQPSGGGQLLQRPGPE